MNKLRALQNGALPFERMQTDHWMIVPVLCCSGVSGLDSAQQQATDAMLVAWSLDRRASRLNVALRPLSVWCELSTIDHLQQLLSGTVPSLEDNMMGYQDKDAMSEGRFTQASIGYVLARALKSISGLTLVGILLWALIMYLWHNAGVMIKWDSPISPRLNVVFLCPRSISQPQFATLWLLNITTGSTFLDVCARTQNFPQGSMASWHVLPRGTSDPRR